MTRREWFALPAALTAVQTLHAAVKPVRITSVDVFGVRIPITRTEAEQGLQAAYSVAQVTTDAGVTGYSFAGPPASAAGAVRNLLAGRDLFALDDHLRRGLGRYGGVEHAIWDAIGKIAGQPVYKLLGGSQDRVKAYLTCVWKGAADQAHVQPRAQVDMALRIQKAGFRGMKIRAWRPNPMEDVDVCRQIKEAAGRDFALMFDRTAEMPVSMAGQKVWDYETGLKVARALERAGAYWLEEPFARSDYETPARLAATVSIPITGGEGYTGLEPYRQCLVHKTYRILQPDGRNAGGILQCRKVGILAESFGVPCILHGIMSLALAGWLQATLANGAEWQEMALISPPLLPEQQWAPGLKLLRSKEMFRIDDGYLLAPPYAGLGLDVDPEALIRYRVS